MQGAGPVLQGGVSPRVRPSGRALLLVDVLADDRGHHGKADDHDFDTWNARQMVDQLCWIRDLGATEVTTPLPRLESYQHFIERLHWLAEEIMPRIA